MELIGHAAQRHLGEVKHIVHNKLEDFAKITNIQQIFTLNASCVGDYIPSEEIEPDCWLCKFVDIRSKAITDRDREALGLDIGLDAPASVVSFTANRLQQRAYISKLVNHHSLLIKDRGQGSNLYIDCSSDLRLLGAI